MKKKIIIIAIILMLVLSGCSKANQEINSSTVASPESQQEKANSSAPVASPEREQEKTNYIAPMALSQREQEIINLVTPGRGECILCEFDASDYKEMSMRIEKYKYGELVESSDTSAVVSDTSLGKGKLYMEFVEEEFEMAISCRSCTKCSTSFDEKIPATIVYVALDKEISLEDDEKILLYRAYGEENETSVKGYNVEHLMLNGNID
jgi:hypothetical protein